MGDTWLHVVGYFGLYQVSDSGQVRSTARMKVLKSTPNPVTGHHTVILHKEGKARTHYVHRLVLEAFVGPCPEGMESRHYPDRDPANNCKDNLSWATRTVNQRDRREHGTSNDARGEKNFKVKLTESRVRRIKFLHFVRGWGGSELASVFGVSPAATSNILLGKTWKHV